jgi:hypothetical protein
VSEGVNDGRRGAKDVENDGDTASNFVWVEEGRQKMDAEGGAIDH